MASTIYVHISAYDEPNIGVMECNPQDGIKAELLKEILESHFDVECKIIDIQPNPNEGLERWTAQVVVDVQDWKERTPAWETKGNYEITLARTWVYHL
jgi:hypothetical protein